MPAFKPKANKPINVCKKYLTTLDGKHTEFVNEFIEKISIKIQSDEEVKMSSLVFEYSFVYSLQFFFSFKDFLPNRIFGHVLGFRVFRRIFSFEF